MQQEVKDLRQRIESLEKKIDKLEVVSDTVKGTRVDGTYGSIKITGYPIKKYDEIKSDITKAKLKMQSKELKLLELMSDVEEYIETIPKSELRIMFRLYYIDALNWIQVADRMNRAYANRRKCFTADSCRMKNNRFFEEN